MDKKATINEPLWFVHYGHEQYEPEEFKLARNNDHFSFYKPVGGLWGCQIKGKNNWLKWCFNNEYKLDKYRKENCFYFRISSSKNMLTVSNKDDYIKLPKRTIELLQESIEVVDFEKLMDEGIGDGYNIYALNIDFEDLEELDECFPGYDCNCVLILDDCILLKK